MRKQRGRGPMEYKAIPLSVKVDEQGFFEGFAAVSGNVDKQNDVLEIGAVTKTLQETPEVPTFWMHDVTEPIGISRSMVEVTGGVKTGLKVSGQLAMGVQRARETRELAQLGAIKGLSIGYVPVKATYDNKGIRHLKEIKVFEFSFVPFPANPLATIDTVKGLHMATKYFGLYDEDTDDVGCLLAAIAALTDFAQGEAEEGETDDLAAVQSILGALAALLASELSELGGQDQAVADAEAVPEGMSARLANYFTKEGRVLSTSNRKLVTQARDALQALLDGSEPAKATRAQDGAATKETAEPGDHSGDVTAELAAMTAAFRRRHT